VEKYSEDTLKKYGILPWHIQSVMYKLTKAFQDENAKEIIRLSTDLGHYVGDAHVPLHTTSNYNGQQTNQKGIHAFWESRIPELSGEHYNYLVGRATYIPHLQSDVWSTIQNSYNAVDSVLNIEAALNQSFPKDRKFVFEDKGNVLRKTYSVDYSRAYEKALNGMVERQMTKAVHQLGSYWYTAWVNSGQPNLNSLVANFKSNIESKTEKGSSKKISNARSHEH